MLPSPAETGGTGDGFGLQLGPSNFNNTRSEGLKIERLSTTTFVCLELLLSTLAKRSSLRPKRTNNPEFDRLGRTQSERGTCPAPLAKPNFRLVGLGNGAECLSPLPETLPVQV